MTNNTQSLIPEKKDLPKCRALCKNGNLKRMEYMICNICNIKSIHGLPNCCNRIKSFEWKCPCREELYSYSSLNTHKHKKENMLANISRKDLLKRFREDRLKKKKLVNDLSRVSIVKLAE